MKEVNKMLIKHKNETIEVVTIKELYEMAVAKGIENAAIGISFYDGDSDVEYVQETKFKDIEFGDYYEQGEKICPCIWLNNHEL